MKRTLTRKLIEEHLVAGEAETGAEIGLRIDQSLTQDATGTMVMLELEAMAVDRIRTEVSVQYVDHNLVQADHRNPDDHLFLESACRRFGVWYSPAGNGVSHPVHQERFGVPGKTLLGSDSHTPAAGALGMLAFGAGGIEVALAMVGAPYHLPMPEVWGVELAGELRPGVSAKDVILELLRRYGVDAGSGRIIEYHGPGLAGLSAMDRHVIANMGTELGATSSVFPADAEVRCFLERQERGDVYSEWRADEGAEYDHTERIDLGELEPLIARPSSPGNVVPVREIAGARIHQATIGSSANPGYRDFAVAARMVAGRRVKPWVSFDVNPTSRQILENLMGDGHLATLVHAGARIHQAGCNGCIGMGQAPASDTISLRTVPRNFPGRSGTKDDQVYLCSPETAAASALTGVITDPTTLDDAVPAVDEPEEPRLNLDMLVPPPPPEEARAVELRKGPNIEALPELEPLPDDLSGPVLLAVGDDISTDEILPAGARVLPYRSNIPEIARFTFEVVDADYHARACEHAGDDFIVAGRNYGQGSSREHAALAPRHLGLRAVIAHGFARIHWQNLVAFGALPLTFVDPADRDRIDRGHELVLREVAERLAAGHELTIENRSTGEEIRVEHRLSPRQMEILRSGSLLRWFREHGQHEEEAH